MLPGDILLVQLDSPLQKKKKKKKKKQQKKKKREKKKEIAYRVVEK